MPRSVVLITNTNKPRAMEASARVVELIQQHGKLVAELESFQDTPLPDPHEVDLVIALGGDGTILSAARRCIDLDAPLLGINTGKVGFMAGYELDSFEHSAADLLSESTLNIHKTQPMNATLMSHDGKQKQSVLGINDFVVTAGPPYRMITLNVSVNDQPGPSVSGDGLIVSSPLGSTAYNVSAGGPIVSPGVDAVVVTPIAAHSLSFRPFVIPSSSTLKIQISDVNRVDNHGTSLIIDGQECYQVEENDVLEVSSASKQINFVHDPAVSYWNTLLNKMHWASEPMSNGHQQRSQMK